MKIRMPETLCEQGFQRSRALTQKIIVTQQNQGLQKVDTLVRHVFLRKNHTLAPQKHRNPLNNLKKKFFPKKHIFFLVLLFCYIFISLSLFFLSFLRLCAVFASLLESVEPACNDRGLNSVAMLFMSAIERHCFSNSSERLVRALIS